MVIKDLSNELTLIFFFSYSKKVFVLSELKNTRHAISLISVSQCKTLVVTADLNPNIQGHIALKVNHLSPLYLLSAKTVNLVFSIK